MKPGTMIMMKKSALAVLIVWFSAQLAGCATASQSGAMATGPVTVANRNSATVSVAVTGGKETSAMGASQISNAVFQDAIRQSLLASGLFGSVVDARTGRYHLDAYIALLSQPVMGFAFTVKMEVNYTLTDVSTGQVVWRAPIGSEHTTTTSDAFSGLTRLRLANEGAARRNIEAAIGEMGKLKLP